MTPAEEMLVSLRALLRPLVRQLVEEALAESKRSPATTESFIGTAEAARRLGVKPDTVVAWIDRGMLPATRLPGARSWRIKPEDLEVPLAERPDAGAPRSREVPRLVDARAHRLAEAVRKGAQK